MAKNTVIPKGADGQELRPIHEQVPDFMREDNGQGSMDLIKQFIVPPRIKVIQPTAKKPFNELFKPGNLCVVPQVKGIWTEEFKPGQPNLAFHFVPILFWPEWVTWNPLGFDGPAIRSRSLDKKCDIAIKSRDPERRKEKISENGREIIISHLEHLNYLILILPPHELEGLPIILNFASGEHRSGTNFNALLQQRKTGAMYGCQFAAKVGRRENSKGTWYGIDIDNPDPESGVTPFVMDRERYDVYKRINAEYAGYARNQELQADYDDDAATVDGTVAPPKTEF